MKLIYKILIVHFFIIFLVGAATSSLPSDMIENLMWGRSLGFASDKHPPFFGWQSYITVKLFAGNLTFYHILTPLNQIIFLFFLYLLAKEILKDEKKAIACVVLLQSVVFHSFYYKFNANTANLAFFGAIYYVFYKTLKERKYHLYPILATLCAVIMLIKYSGILLIGTIGLITLITKEGRESLKSPFLFIGIVVFFAILTPYILHLLKQESNGAISYLMEQSEGYKWFTLPRFIGLQLLPFLPLLIGFFSVLKGRIKRSVNFEYIFLMVGFLTPLTLTAGYILVKQASVGFFWLSMFYGLTPIVLLYFYKVKKDFLKTLYKIIYPIFAVMFIVYFTANIFNAEDDTKQVEEFVKNIRKEDQITSDYYICNDSRRMCGMVILYGTDYSTSVMHLSKWKDGFQYFKEEKEKPNDMIIIGDRYKIDLEGYTLKTHIKEIPKYYKFEFVERFFSNPPIFLRKYIAKLPKPVIVILIITAKKINYE